MRRVIITLFLLSAGILFFKNTPQEPDIHAQLRQRILEAELGSTTAVLFAKNPDIPVPSQEPLSNVVQQLADDSPVQRWQAADELVKRADTRAVDALIAAMLDPSGTRRVCVMASALGKLKDPRALSALTHAAFDPNNRDLRLCAIQSLGMINDRKAVPTLIRAVQERNMPIAAANALAKLGDERAVNVLMETANDPELSLWMINALGELGAASAILYLRGLSETPQNRQLQRATKEALWKLSILSNEHPIETLQQVLAQDQVTSRRSWAAYKLGERKSNQSASALIQALQDKQTEVSSRAAAALVITGEAVLPSIRQAFQNADSNPWLTAILGYLGKQDDTVVLRRLVKLQEKAATVAEVSLTMIERRESVSGLESIVPEITGGLPANTQN